MRSDAERHFSEPRGMLGLWLGILLPAVAWALHLNVNYMLVQWICQTGWRLVFHFVTIGALAAIVGSAWIAWRNWRAAGREWPSGSEGTVVRSRFMAAAGLLLSLYFGTVVVAQSIPTWLLECR